VNKDRENNRQPDPVESDVGVWESSGFWVQYRERVSSKNMESTGRPGPRSTFLRLFHENVHIVFEDGFDRLLLYSNVADGSRVGPVFDVRSTRQTRSTEERGREDDGNVFDVHTILVLMVHHPAV